MWENRNCVSLVVEFLILKGDPEFGEEGGLGTGDVRPGSARNLLELVMMNCRGLDYRYINSLTSGLQCLSLSSLL